MANNCNNCNFVSSEAGSLRKHLKTHSGEKPNKCNHCDYALDRFTKRLLWNIVWSRPVSMEEYYAESMLENTFCSNVAPSPSSGPPLIYKAKYKGLISKNQYPAITFDWSVLRTWGQRLWAAFLLLFSGIPHLPTFCHVARVTYVTSRVSRTSHKSRVKCRVR